MPEWQTRAVLITRRALLLRGALLGAGAAGLAGCRHHAAAPTTPVPDRAALQRAHALELPIVAAFEAAAAAFLGDRQVLDALDAHRAHLAALANRLGVVRPSDGSAGTSSPSAGPSTMGDGKVLLSTALRAASDSVPTFEAFAVAATDNAVAALLASIAAAHATGFGGTTFTVRIAG